LAGPGGDEPCQRSRHPAVVDHGRRGFPLVQA
jgi:hypothetical protein